MIEGISAGLSSLNAAMGLLKALNAANTQAAINEIKLDLQERIFEARETLTAAREAQTAALQRIRELEQEVVSLKDWETEKQRYELRAIDARAFAYMHKPGMESGEPPLWLCQTCFEHGQKSVLQFTGQAHHGAGALGLQAAWRCNACNARVSVFFQRYPGAG